MDLRTYFAPEVERAVLSLIWHKPELLGTVLRELHPEVHFEPPNRILLEAFNVLYSEQGALDWALTIEYLRQNEVLEALGNTQTLDEIYSLWPDTSPHGGETLLGYYIGLLKDYAKARGAKPPEMPLSFAAGRGELWPNPDKNYPSQPDFLGKARVAGRLYKLRGWNAQSPDGLSIIQIRFESPLGHGRNRNS